MPCGLIQRTAFAAARFFAFYRKEEGKYRELSLYKISRLPTVARDAGFVTIKAEHKSSTAKEKEDGRKRHRF